MNFWLVKCRKYLPHKDGWSWDSYFDGTNSEYAVDDEWGGPDWIGSNQSKKYIREEVLKGDIVVCYQYEGRRICGFTRMAGNGRDEPRGSHDFNMLFLAAAKKGMCIEPELTVEQVRATGCDPEWLGKGQGTVFPISPDEFTGIIRAVRIHCPAMEDILERWLQRLGFDAEMYTIAAPQVTRPKLPSGGAGFSTDPAQNSKVEQAAIRIVTRSFRKRGWEVRDVQRACLGFDLICTKGKRKREVEVKGVSGSRESFPITFREARKAETNADFMICIVTEALSPRPNVQELTGREFLSIFKLQPISYMARR